MGHRERQPHRHPDHARAGDAAGLAARAFSRDGNKDHRQQRLRRLDLGCRDAAPAGDDPGRAGPAVVWALAVAGLPHADHQRGRCVAAAVFRGRLCAARARPAGHAGQILSGQLSADASRLLTTSADKTARLWNVESGQPLDVLSGHTEAVLSGEFSSDGERVVTASRDGTARIFTLGGGQHLLRLGGHRDMVLHATYSPDGRYIATASADRSAKVWAAESGEELASVTLPDSVQAVAFRPRASIWRPAAATLDRTVRIWDWKQRRVVVELSIGGTAGHHRAVVCARSAALGSTSSDGTRCACGTFARGSRYGRLRPQPAALAQLAFSPRGNRMVVSEVSGAVRVWDVARGQVLYSLPGGTGRGAGAAFFSRRDAPGGGWPADPHSRSRAAVSSGLVGHLDATAQPGFARRARVVTGAAIGRFASGTPAAALPFDPAHWRR